MHCLLNRKGAAVEWLGLLVLALILEQEREIVKPFCYVRVIWLLYRFFNREGAAVERFTLLVLALILERIRQVVQCPDYLWVIWSAITLLNRKNPAALIVENRKKSTP